MPNESTCILHITFTHVDIELFQMLRYLAIDVFIYIKFITEARWRDDNDSFEIGVVRYRQRRGSGEFVTQ